MAKLVAWSNATPVGATPAGGGAGGDKEIQSIKTWLEDECVHDGVPNDLRPRQGSAKAFIGTEANVAAWVGGGVVGTASVIDGTDEDTGRLAKSTNGPFGYYDNATGAFTRIVGGRYARVTPAASAAFAVGINTWANIPNFVIAAFDFQAWVYRLHATVHIGYAALPTHTPIGLRFCVTDSGATTYDYEFLLDTGQSGILCASVSAVHDHATLAGALGNGTVHLQAYSVLGGNMRTTPAGLAGWAAAAYQYDLTVMEI